MLLSSQITAKKKMRRILAAINKFEGAAVDFSWKGSLHPADYDAINRRYDSSKKELIALIEREIKE